MEDGVSNGRAAAAVRGDHDARPSTRRRGPGPEEGRTAVAGRRPAAESHRRRRRRRAGSECRQRGARHAAGERRRRRPPRTRRSSRTLHSLSLSLGVHCSSSSRPVERSLGGLIYHMPGYRTNRGRTTRGAAAFRTWHSWVLSHSLTSWYHLVVDS